MNANKSVKSAKKSVSVAIAAARDTLLSHAVECATHSERAAAMYAETSAAAAKRAASTLKAHAHYSEALSKLDDAAIAYALTLRADAADVLCAASREAKKRAVDVLNAIAHKRTMRADTRAAFALFAAKSERDAFRVSEVQREMQHDTTTQALYLTRFLCMFDAAQYDSEAKTITVKRDSALMRDALAIV